MNTTVLTPEQADIVKSYAHEMTDSKIIYDGKIMTRDAAHKLITAQQVHSRHTFFDPLDELRELTNANLKYEAMSGLAWAIDNMCINSARNLFYNMREVKSGSIDNFNEFIAHVAEVQGNESYNEDLGYEENTGLIKSLSMLLSLRPKWHELAATFGRGIGAVYKPNTLEMLIAKEKPMAATEDTLGNLEVLAKMATRKHPAQFEKVHAMMVKQEADRIERVNKGRKLTAPAVINIFNVATYRSDYGDAVEFHTLSDDVQLRLTMQCKSAVERALTRIASRKGVTKVAYAVACTEAFDLIDKLDEVIALKTAE